MLWTCTRRRLCTVPAAAAAAAAAPSSLRLSPAVADAVRSGAPVVALESTIITHGMPFPDNLRTAREVEAIVQQHGAVPATVAVLDGVPHVGLTDAQLQTLAQLPRDAVTKTSRRDLAVVAGLGRHGATTVSGTMLLAHAAGIDVFVTGGVGGVHRGAELSMDVSADLMELGRTPVAVVCAGVKSILDIPKTLEVLESHGVTVLGLSCDSFPAFFTASSPHPCPNRVDSVDDAARVLVALKDLHLQHGMLLAVPNPDPADEATIEAAVATAVDDARRAGVSGKDETPYLLQRVNELTGGASLASNVALIRNNAAVGAQLAVKAKRLAAGGGVVGASRRGFSTAAAAQRHPVVLGGAVVDLVSQPSRPLIHGTSNPGVVKQTFGGVARNVAEALARLGTVPVFVSAVGQDASGAALRAALTAVGVTAHLHSDPGTRTATYSALLDADGDLVAAVADMDAFDALHSRVVDDAMLADASCCVVDANVPTDVLGDVARRCAAAGVPVVFEPTSVPKAGRMAHAGALRCVTVATPNLDEVKAMAAAHRKANGLPSIRSMFDADSSSDGSDDDSGSDDDDDDDDDDAGCIASHTASATFADDGSVTQTTTHSNKAAASDVDADVDADSDADSDGTVELDSYALCAAQTVLAAMCAPADGDGSGPSHVPTLDGRKHLFVTLGGAGMLALSAPVCRSADDYHMMLDLTFFQAVYACDMAFRAWAPVDVPLVNCTGAGDSFVGGLVWGVHHGRPVDDCVGAGLSAAALTVQSWESVSPDMAPDTVERLMAHVAAAQEVDE